MEFPLRLPYGPARRFAETTNSCGDFLFLFNWIKIMILQGDNDSYDNGKVGDRWEMEGGGGEAGVRYMIAVLLYFTFHALTPPSQSPRPSRPYLYLFTSETGDECHEVAIHTVY